MILLQPVNFSQYSAMKFITAVYNTYVARYVKDTRILTNSCELSRCVYYYLADGDDPVCAAVAAHR